MSKRMWDGSIELLLFLNDLGLNYLWDAIGMDRPSNNIPTKSGYGIETTLSLTRQSECNADTPNC
ncbi:MAG: hypothetical protein AB3N16_01215 [Flavobacteriaceae bacterium]